MAAGASASAGTERLRGSARIEFVRWMLKGASGRELNMEMSERGNTSFGRFLFELIYDFLVERHIQQTIDLRAFGEVFFA